MSVRTVMLGLAVASTSVHAKHPPYPAHPPKHMQPHKPPSPPSPPAPPSPPVPPSLPPSPSSPPPLPNSPPTTKRAYVQGRQLIVNNKPFLVKGICYSPVPINASVYWDPLGDYFSEEYSYIWLRDLPLMKAMGANVVRIYGWDSDKDHTPFLDAVRDNGLYLMTTFFMGEAVETPVNTATQRANVIKRFQKAVKQYRHHPALLIWSIGNEINGVWNGFLQQLSNSEVDPCGWDETYDDLGGCWTHLGIKPIYNSQCYNTSLCVYKRLYGFLNDCAVAAHELADVIVTSTFADVDALYDKVERMGQFAPDLDAWSAQVYRGASFGDFFTGISNSTGKPLLLTEHARTPQDRRPPAVGPPPHTRLGARAAARHPTRLPARRGRPSGGPSGSGPSGLSRGGAASPPGCSPPGPRRHPAAAPPTPPPIPTAFFGDAGTAWTPTTTCAARTGTTSRRASTRSTTTRARTSTRRRRPSTAPT
jgi:hypothetical protein